MSTEYMFCLGVRFSHNVYKNQKKSQNLNKLKVLAQLEHVLGNYKERVTWWEKLQKFKTWII